jgi:hypothetical protein
MPPPTAAYYYQRPPPSVTPGEHVQRKQLDNVGSPKRLSLDERLERELGIKMEKEQEQQQLLQQQVAQSGDQLRHHHTSSLPATVPTYDNSPVDQPQPRAVPLEKEQAMAAAQVVTTKLLEMQAAKEAERRRKRELRLAERQRQLLQIQEGGPAATSVVGEQRVAAARILEQVEQQELATEEQKVSSSFQKRLLILDLN